MRIGVDASCWTNNRGYGRYTRELLKAILELDTNNQYVFFLDDHTERQCTDLPRRADRVIVRTSASAAGAASARGYRSVSDLWAMSRAVRSKRHALDLLYFPSVYTFFPVPRRLTTLVTIHDTIAERHPGLIFPHWHNRLFWTMKVRWAVRQAALILTVSETAKLAVTRQFGLTDDRVRIVPDAVSPEFQPTQDTQERRGILSARGINPGERFLLYVGGISPHKSLETLVDAHAELIRDPALQDVRLVLVGDYKRDVFFSSYDSLKRRAGPRVLFTGFIPDAELRHWYSAASAMVLPSLDEGFGLPVIEAMACGTPVVASQAGALPEVVANAGLLFEPGNVSALVSALKSLLNDPGLGRSLAWRGRERAARFTWQASARAAIEAFESRYCQSA